MCFDGDFPVVSSDDGHQVLGAKAAILKQATTFFMIPPPPHAIHSLSLDFTIW
jgi:hypothetical protein